MKEKKRKVEKKGKIEEERRRGLEIDLLAYSLTYFAGLALFFIATISFLYFGWKYRAAVEKNVQEKKDLYKTVACIMIALVGVVLLTSTPPSPLASLEAETNVSAFVEGLNVIESRLERFSKQVTPISCEGARDLVYWRELRVYNVTRIDAQGRKKSVYYSTITLNLENKGLAPFLNVIVREKIPLSVATDPAELINHSITPLRVTKGSVVVEWLFSQIMPGEQQNVSYTVEKNLSEDVLKDFEPPSIIIKMIASPPPSPTPTPLAGIGLNLVLFAIAIIIALIAALLYYSRKRA